MPFDNVDFNLLQRLLDRTNSVHNLTSALNVRVMELSKKLEKPDVVEKIDEEKRKKKMDDIFKKKSVGRPSGSLVEKQQQYFDLVKSGKIKSPVQKTLDYYQITRDEKGE